MMTKAPDAITPATLDVVVMPNGEVICLGKTVGWVETKKKDDALGKYLNPKITPQPNAPELQAGRITLMLRANAAQVQLNRTAAEELIVTLRTGIDMTRDPTMLYLTFTRDEVSGTHVMIASDDLRQPSGKPS